MNICLLCYRGNPYCGGQGIYLYHLSRELAQLGHRVTVIVGPPFPERMPWAKVVKIPNHHFWGKRQDFIPGNRPMEIFGPLNFFEFASSRLGYFPEIFAFSVRAFNAFYRMHRHNPFDLVHDVETLGYGLLLTRRAGVPALSTVHHPLSKDMAAHLLQSSSLVERYYNVVFFPLIMQGIVARRIEGIITSSRNGKSEIGRSFRVPLDRIHLVYTGIDLTTFSSDLQTKRNEGEILFVGNAQDPRKGVLYLLQALNSLPKDLRLTIIDDGKPAKNYAPELVHKMALEDRVTFTGKLPLEQLVDRYRRAAVLVMPSLFEGFGLPVAEAMACGTPVIASRAGSLSEVVGEDQEGGRLVPPGDPEALAATIREVMSNPDAAHEIGLRGRNRVKRLFSWEHTARHTSEVYERVRQVEPARMKAVSV